jgi:hypothetical protein
MKLIVPYANDISDPAVHACVRLSLTRYRDYTEWVRLNEPNSYALLWQRLWDEGEPFIVIEHDVIAWPGAIEHVWTCERPFCGFEGNLQCVKLMPSTREWPIPDWVPWYKFDGQLLPAMAELGIEYHDHCSAFSLPPVTNLNRYVLEKL